MSLRSIVKVSHISNLSDARYCAGMGVEMLGFCVVEGQNRYMAPDLFQDIRGWISGPAIVAQLYGITSVREIDIILKTYSPDYLEMTLEEYKLFGNLPEIPCLIYLQKMSSRTALASDSRISKLIVDEHAACGDLSGIRVPVLSKVSSLEKLSKKLTEGCFQGYVLEAPQEIRPGLTNYDQLGVILEALEE